MANKIFSGERLALSGQLKNHGELVTGEYTVVCKIYNENGLIRKLVLNYDAETQRYYANIDTSRLCGQLEFRFCVHTESGDEVVGNESIFKTIYK